MADQPGDEIATDDSNEGLQNSPVHEGGGPAPIYDTNEKADDKVEVLQPDGDPVPTAEKEERG